MLQLRIATAFAIVMIGAGCGGGDGTVSFQVESTGTPNLGSGTTGLPPGNTGNPGNTGGNTGTQKTIFSIWNNGFYTFDLRTASFGAPATVPVSFNGQSCSCSATITGSEANGNLSISTCSGSVMCAAFGTTGNYFRVGTDLMLCNPSGQCTAFF